MLILPPFTQLNTPYPSTAYLKGFLNTKKITAFQSDLGIEVILALFNSKGLQSVFKKVNHQNLSSDNSRRIFTLKEDYCSTIDAVISFLQNQNPILAHAICETDFLPKAARFNQTDTEELEWAFGNMGQQDKARHLATLYLEDIADFIKAEIDPYFGFSRYADRLAQSSAQFDDLNKALKDNDSFINELTIEILDRHLKNVQPKLVALSVPFPGNLYSALKCGHYIKKKYPHIKVALGGGFANTELRSVKDHRVFSYTDFICLDDGEATLYHLWEYIEGKRKSETLKRTFLFTENAVKYVDGSDKTDYAQKDVGTPDYSDLLLNSYLSVIELANPMHSLWSNGRWNKLTLAHGCYWGKCTFCDISLDYIKRYEQTTAPMLCDRISEIMLQTGTNGFHFVDEAAPPALLRDLAIEIIRRKMKIVWWTNIRFEKSFTKDLCRLLKASGCIAMSGGLEVASNRLLKLIDKGVTVEQVARVCNNFTQSGIMVHAYLMYGYPTQTEQETIDSLEMVRQLFYEGIIQSGFWHRFALTTHSPVGMNPDNYGIKITQQEGLFANNDLDFEELQPRCDHGNLGEGLKRSLYNYMRGVGFDLPLSAWFDTQVVETKIKNNYISSIINQEEGLIEKQSGKIIFLGTLPEMISYNKSKKGKTINGIRLNFVNRSDEYLISLEGDTAKWIGDYFHKFIITNQSVLTFAQFKRDFELNFPNKFDDFWQSENAAALRFNGLVVV